jgi:Ca-activated chloride channel homolog
MLCTLALVLLLDSSGSVPDPAWEMQVQAHADALADPAIGRIIEREGGAAVMVAGFHEAPHTLVSWRFLETAADAAAMARTLAGAPRPGNGLTHTGRALAWALDELRRAPCVADRQVIDLVTDGPGDDPALLDRARTEAEARDVRINALAVITIPGLDAVGFLRHQVVTPGGFVMSADGWEDVAAALRRKITWEISGR